MVGLSQNVALSDFRCLKDIDFLATVFAEDGGGIGNRCRSKSDIFRIKIGQRLITGVIAGPTCIVVSGGF